MTTMLSAPVISLAEACQVLKLEVPADASPDLVHALLCAEWLRLGGLLARPSALTGEAVGKIRARAAVDRRLIEAVLAGHGLLLYRAEVEA